MRARYGQIRHIAGEQVATLVIDRPPHNFVTLDLITDLAEALVDIDAEQKLRATVLAASGRSFCAGADFGGPELDAAALYRQATRLFAARKPIVAAIQGAAVGAGLGLALVADFRIASADARFSANFVKLGIHPGFGITHTLPRLVGPQRAALMCLTGRRIKPDEALAWGLIDMQVDASDLLEAAKHLAHEIAGNAPLAVQSTRATLRNRLAASVSDRTAHELQEQIRLQKTTDFLEGVRAVAERRPGVFNGE